MLDASPPAISPQFLNLQIASSQLLQDTLNPNLKGLNPNPKSQIKTLIPKLKSVSLTLCPNPYSLKS